MEKYSEEISVEFPFLVGRKYSVCGTTFQLFIDPSMSEDEFAFVYPNGDMKKFSIKE